jgi:hypothetical protein
VGFEIPYVSEYVTKYAGHVQNKFQTTLIENVIVSENEDATFPIHVHGPTEIYRWIVWGLNI